MDKTPMAMTDALRIAATAAAPGVPAIRFQAVAKRYRDREVLRAVSFEVPAGSSVAIAGVNGAGKSTLLRCLLDFARPDGGRIFIGDCDSDALHARAQLGWLPERFVPPAHLSARECLEWLAGLRGTTLDVTLMETMAAELGLDARALASRVRELSKGMTQKLGLMSIGLSDCPIWVLDEPMSGLDPLARRNVTRLIDGARAAGRTVLFTTHGLRDLPALCDRLVVLHQGTVRYCGGLEEFADRYETADLELAFLACLQDAMPVAINAASQHALEGCTA
jgi:ABC-2 type transport system ATP-binding protein